MSSLRTALGPMAFSARQSRQWSGRGTPHITPAWNAASMPAAPAMSHFMPTMEPPTLSDRPPVSNMIPFPTSAMPGNVASATPGGGVYDSTTSAGASTAALPTPQMPPKPPSRNCMPTISVNVTPFDASASATARASRRMCVVVISSGGVSTRREAKRTPSAAACTAASVAGDTAGAQASVTSAAVTVPRVWSFASASLEAALVLAVNTGSARATATEVASACAGGTTSTTVALSLPSIPPRRVLTACGWAGLLWRLHEEGRATHTTFRGLPPLLLGTQVVLEPPLSALLEAASTREAHTGRASSGTSVSTSAASSACLAPSSTSGDESSEVGTLVTKRSSGAGCAAVGFADIATKRRATGARTRSGATRRRMRARVAVGNRAAAHIQHAVCATGPQMARCHVGRALPSRMDASQRCRSGSLASDRSLGRAVLSGLPQLARREAEGARGRPCARRRVAAGRPARTARWAVSSSLQPIELCVPGRALCRCPGSWLLRAPTSSKRLGSSPHAQHTLSLPVASQHTP